MIVEQVKIYSCLAAEVFSHEIIIKSSLLHFDISETKTRISFFFFPEKSSWLTVQTS